MADISNEELKQNIEEILKNADLNKVGTKTVIQQLEKRLGVSLSDKKSLIDQLVMDYVNNMDSDDDEDEEDEEEEESEEEEKPKPKPKAKPKAKAKTKKRKADDDDDEEDDDSRDSDYGSSKKKKSPEKKKAKGKGGAKGGGAGKGYTRAYKLSPELAELMGEDKLPRHEVVKRVWAIVKEKQLFDPSNRKFAICDSALLKVIGIKRFQTFGMMKYLKTHFIDD